MGFGQTAVPHQIRQGMLSHINLLEAALQMHLDARENLPPRPVSLPQSESRGPAAGQQCVLLLSLLRAN